MSRLGREGAPHERVRITRLGTRDEAELDAVEALAAECFTGEPFSAREELTRPWSLLWAAHIDEGDGPAGFLVGWHVADELHVLNVATRPQLRRRGIGRALMDAALAYAAEKHVRIMLLEVRRSNRPAIKLYRALGFTALGVRPRYYADNDEDAIEMILGMDPETGHILPGKDEIRIDG